MLLASGIISLLILITALFVAAFTTLAIDRLLRLELPTRLGLAAIAGAIILYVVYRKLIQPLRLPLDNLDLAELDTVFRGRWL